MPSVPALKGFCFGQEPARAERISGKDGFSLSPLPPSLRPGISISPFAFVQDEYHLLTRAATFGRPWTSLDFSRGLLSEKAFSQSTSDPPSPFPTSTTLVQSPIYRFHRHFLLSSNESFRHTSYTPLPYRTNTHQHCLTPPVLPSTTHNAAHLLSMPASYSQEAELATTHRRCPEVAPRRARTAPRDRPLGPPAARTLSVCQPHHPHVHRRLAVNI